MNHNLLLSFLLTAAVTTTSTTVSAQRPECDVPSQGCRYGMYNFDKCECDCIQPFCKDANGDCTLPLDNCGGNPWKKCVRGENCPWWNSLSSAETCITGTTVPIGVWEIYNTKQICCGVHHPFSMTCNNAGQIQVPVANNTPRPTKTPTISMPLVPDTEDVTLKFALTGLPNDVDISKLKENVLEAIKIILAKLTNRVPSMQISQINERVCRGRRLLRRRSTVYSNEQPIPRHNEQLKSKSVGVERKLKDVSVCYVIEVVNDDSGQDYEPLIVTEARDSYEVILDEIRTKMNYVNVGMDLGTIGGEGVVGGGQQSTNGNGGTNGDGANPAVSSTNGGAGGLNTNGTSGGLPVWGVALIVILLLLLSCCVGYCIFAAVRKKRDKDEAVNILINNRSARAAASKRPSNRRSQYASAPPSRRRSFTARSRQALRASFSRNQHMSDRPRRDGDRRRRRPSRYNEARSALRSSFTDVTDRVSRRSRRPRKRRNDDNSEFPSISLSKPQDPKFDADAFTVNTYKTAKRNAQDPPMNALTMPGYEPDYTKPDPDGETAGSLLLLTNGDDNTRRYAEDPNTKPKLEPEPTLYIEAAPLERSQRSRRSGRSSRSESPSIFGPSVAGTVDPSVESEGGSNEVEDDNEDEYDQYGFRLSQPQIYVPKRLNKNAEDLEETLTYTTKEPKEDGRRKSKKKKKKHKKRHKKSKELLYDDRRRSSSGSGSPRRRSSTTDQSSGNHKQTSNLQRLRSSGVDSIESEVGSIDFESSRSS